MPVVVHRDKCKGCKRCIEACPYAAIRIEDKKAVPSAGCTHCGACIDSCRFGAIGFEGSQERIRMDCAPFKGIHVFIEHSHTTASRVSLELLGAARGLAEEFSRLGRSQEVTAVLICHEPGDIADELIYGGADHVIVVADESFGVYRTEPYTRALVQVAREKKPEILLFGATPLGRDLAPRVANRLRTGLTADCTGLEICTKDRILLQTRPAFGGNVMATIVCPDNRPQMATVRPGVMRRSFRDPQRTGTRERMTVGLDEKDFVTRVLDLVASTRRSSRLEDARIVVAGGHGVKSPRGFRILEELAAELHAEVGASRAAVDAGWIGQDRQVGQTGKTVHPELYIACGISGSIQHLAGMSQSRYVISINSDRKAPIVSASNVAFFGDLFQIVPMLTQKIREHKARDGKA